MAQSFTANDICTELEKSERKEKTQTLQVLFLTQSQQEVPVPTAVGGGFTFQHMFRMEQSYRPRGGSGRAASSPLPPYPPPRLLQPPWPCRGLSSWWLPCPCGSRKGAQPWRTPGKLGPGGCAQPAAGTDGAGWAFGGFSVLSFCFHVRPGFGLDLSFPTGRKALNSGVAWCGFNKLSPSSSAAWQEQLRASPASWACANF